MSYYVHSMTGVGRGLRPDDSDPVSFDDYAAADKHSRAAQESTGRVHVVYTDKMEEWWLAKKREGELKLEKLQAQVPLADRVAERERKLKWHAAVAERNAAERRRKTLAQISRLESRESELKLELIQVQARLKSLKGEQ